MVTNNMHLPLPFIEYVNTFGFLNGDHWWGDHVFSAKSEDEWKSWLGEQVLAYDSLCRDGDGSVQGLLPYVAVAKAAKEHLLPCKVWEYVPQPEVLNAERAKHDVHGAM